MNIPFFRSCCTIRKRETGTEMNTATGGRSRRVLPELPSPSRHACWGEDCSRLLPHQRLKVSPCCCKPCASISLVLSNMRQLLLITSSAPGNIG